MADLLSRWRAGLAKTCKATFGRIAGILGATEITAGTWDDLEALLIQADLGIETATEVIESLKRFVRTEGLLRSDELEGALRAELRNRLDEMPAIEWKECPSVLLNPGPISFLRSFTIVKRAPKYKVA